MSAPFRSRGRRVIGRDIDQAEYDATQSVSGPLHRIQVLFDSGQREEACQELLALVLRDPSERLSFALRMVEVSRALCRVTNDFGDPWSEIESSHNSHVKLNLPSLFDEVVLSKVASPLGYPYDDMFRRAPYVTDEVFQHSHPSPDHGRYSGAFKPGYNEKDVQIRRKRLRALVKEFSADNNLPAAQMNRLLARCEPEIDDDDPRLQYYRLN